MVLGRRELHRTRPWSSCTFWYRPERSPNPAVPHRLQHRPASQRCPNLIAATPPLQQPPPQTYPPQAQPMFRSIASMPLSSTMAVPRPHFPSLLSQNTMGNSCRDLKEMQELQDTTQTWRGHLMSWRPAGPRAQGTSEFFGPRFRRT